jgi:hypothetical protein
MLRVFLIAVIVGCAFPTKLLWRVRSEEGKPAPGRRQENDHYCMEDGPTIGGKNSLRSQHHIGGSGSRARIYSAIQR